MVILNMMLSAGCGGLEAVSILYARLLQRAACESHIILNARSPYGIPTGVCGMRVSNTSLLNIACHLRIGLAIRRLSPKIVLAHGGRGASFCRSWIVRFLAPRGTLFVGVLHGENAKRFIKLDAVIAVSEKLRDETLLNYEIPAERLYVCPNAVPVPPAAELSPLPLLNGRIPTFGFLGRFDPCKGLDVFLDACATLRRRGIRFRAIIGGSGKDEDTFHRQCARLGLADAITWAGWISDKKAFFDAIDVFVMPSREEAVGLVGLEAMSYARPLVASDCPGPKAIVENARCGRVVPREDAAALAKAMQDCLADPIRLREWGRLGRDAVVRLYSEAALTDCLSNTLSRILENRRQRDRT